MTQTRPDRTLTVPDYESAVTTLRGYGARVSTARRVVLEALYAAEGPLSAEQIADGVGGRVPRSDVASVYRNLEMLERLGVVRHVHLGHSPALYAVAATGLQEYLTCERCADFLAVTPSQLDEIRLAIRRRFGYVASFVHFPIVGLCPGCAQELGR